MVTTEAEILWRRIKRRRRTDLEVYNEQAEEAIRDKINANKLHIDTIKVGRKLSKCRHKSARPKWKVIRSLKTESLLFKKILACDTRL